MAGLVDLTLIGLNIPGGQRLNGHIARGGVPAAGNRPSY